MFLTGVVVWQIQDRPFLAGTFKERYIKGYIDPNWEEISLQKCTAEMIQAKGRGAKVEEIMF